MKRYFKQFGITMSAGVFIGALISWSLGVPPHASIVLLLILIGFTTWAKLSKEKE